MEISAYAVHLQPRWAEESGIYQHRTRFFPHPSPKHLNNGIVDAFNGLVWRINSEIDVRRIIPGRKYHYPQPAHKNMLTNLQSQDWLLPVSLSATACAATSPDASIDTRLWSLASRTTVNDPDDHSPKEFLGEPHRADLQCFSSLTRSCLTASQVQNLSGAWAAVQPTIGQDSDLLAGGLTGGLDRRIGRQAGAGG
ncbi:hypothetical protein B0H19DRAFT_1077343 [Mycena capillaripes]|nr:hypothetical protein B0H19DRAFT_1077343 [Mycena capillaripes]